MPGDDLGRQHDPLSVLSLSVDAQVLVAGQVAGNGAIHHAARQASALVGQFL